MVSLRFWRKNHEVLVLPRCGTAFAGLGGAKEPTSKSREGRNPGGGGRAGEATTSKSREGGNPGGGGRAGKAAREEFSSAGNKSECGMPPRSKTESSSPLTIPQR